VTSTLEAQSSALDASLTRLAVFGDPIGWLLLAAAVALLVVSVTRWRPTWRRPIMTVTVALLAVGEMLLVWFHWRLYALTSIADPTTARVAGAFAVPLWIESEKLYVWALVLGVMALLVRRHREEMEPLLGAGVALLTAAGILVGRPFAQPLPDFLAQFRGWLAVAAGGDMGQRVAAFAQMDGSRQYFYNTWYMWVHPPLLFLSYGCFAVSFAATVLMIARRASGFETTAYRWARLGYLSLTAGMLLGFPWAILAWSGEAWWWSGKVNMSIMMWLVYTAYLHGRLYLRRRGMWRVVAALAVLSFVALVLTYMTTYLVPGAHSVAG
jgi:hypothetical protein